MTRPDSTQPNSMYVVADRFQAERRRSRCFKLITYEPFTRRRINRGRQLDWRDIGNVLFVLLSLWPVAKLSPVSQSSSQVSIKQPLNLQ